MMTNLSPEQIHEEVKARYGRIADTLKLDVQAASCCDDDDLFSNIYRSDTSWLPESVTGLSLGCGDPLALAALTPGQTVLDLGSGGGIDCFMAARQVGPGGEVIGVDMTPSMIEKANRNKAKVGLENVEFRLGQIEALPVASNTVDVILSNCVINLSPDKTAVFREAFRVLKPGGRLAVSDMVTRGRFTSAQRADMEAWAGCITGAEDVADTVAAIRAAGFEQISVRDKGKPDVELAGVPAGEGEAQIFSARVTAVKPPDSKQYFARVAGAWDSLRAGYFTEAMRDAAIAKAELPETAVVADVGTGTGFMLAGLVERVHKLVGFDESPDMLAVARRNLAPHLDKITLHEAPGDRLPAAAGSFDAVFANMVLHHTPDPAAAIREMVRILKPGGKLVLTDLDTHDQAWMREAMADRWLGFERESIREWYEGAGLTAVDIDCAEGTCACSDPDGDDIALSIFVAIGLKKG